MSEFVTYTVIILVKIACVLAVLIGSVPVLVLFERKVLGWMQMRPGPNRVGPWGILQTIVDGVKLFFKEDVIPDGVDRPTYYLAPLLVMLPGLVVACVIPFGPEIELGKWRISLSVTDLDLGLIFVFAVSALTVYGIVLAGWSSNNKWSLLGGLRSAAQMVSYELTLGLSAVGIVLLSGTFNLRYIVEQQAGGFWHWNIVRQPLGFVLFLLAGIAETNRLPFDLPEGESELTGGYHTEYSSMRFALFFMGEYVNIFIMSALVATLFLGGFQLPNPYEFTGRPVDALVGFASLSIKIALFIFVFYWLRGTLPRLRYDQLMSLGWKILLPLAFVNLFATALMIVFGFRLWQMALFGLAALVVADIALERVLWRQRRASA